MNKREIILVVVAVLGTLLTVHILSSETESNDPERAEEVRAQHETSNALTRKDEPEWMEEKQRDTAGLSEDEQAKALHNPDAQTFEAFVKGKFGNLLEIQHWWYEDPLLLEKYLVEFERQLPLVEEQFKNRRQQEYEEGKGLDHMLKALAEHSGKAGTFSDWSPNDFSGLGSDSAVTAGNLLTSQGNAWRKWGPVPMSFYVDTFSEGDLQRHPFHHPAEWTLQSVAGDHKRTEWPEALIQDFRSVHQAAMVSYCLVDAKRYLFLWAGDMAAKQMNRTPPITNYDIVPAVADVNAEIQAIKDGFREQARLLLIQHGVLDVQQDG